MSWHRKCKVATNWNEWGPQSRNQKSEICLFNPFINYIEYFLIYIYFQKYGSGRYRFNITKKGWWSLVPKPLSCHASTLIIVPHVYYMCNRHIIHVCWDNYKCNICIVVIYYQCNSNTCNTCVYATHELHV